MNNIFTFEWLRAAAIRAVKTMAQTALGMITIGSAASELDWKYIASVSLVAGVYSILTSLAGLPEVLGDGDTSTTKTITLTLTTNRITKTQHTKMTKIMPWET